MITNDSVCGCCLFTLLILIALCVILAYTFPSVLLVGLQILLLTGIFLFGFSVVLRALGENRNDEQDGKMAINI